MFKAALGAFLSVVGALLAAHGEPLVNLGPLLGTLLAALGTIGHGPKEGRKTCVRCRKCASRLHVANCQVLHASICEVTALWSAQGTLLLPVGRLERSQEGSRSPKWSNMGPGDMGTNRRMPPKMSFAACSNVSACVHIDLRLYTFPEHSVGTLELCQVFFHLTNSLRRRINIKPNIFMCQKA